MDVLNVQMMGPDVRNVMKDLLKVKDFVFPKLQILLNGQRVNILVKSALSMGNFVFSVMLGIYLILRGIVHLICLTNIPVILYVELALMIIQNVKNAMMDII